MEQVVKSVRLLKLKSGTWLQLNKIDAAVEKVTDIQEMVRYGIMMTPGLIINEKVKSFGIIPKDDQLLNWLKEN